MRMVCSHNGAQKTIKETQANASLAWSFFFSALCFLLPESAWAAGTSASSLGALICNIKNNSLSAYPGMLSAVSYVIGAFLAVRCILLFKMHGENSSQPRVVPAVAHGVASSAFLSLPTFAGVLQKSLFNNAAGGNNFACSASSIGTGSGPVGLDIMMQNFVKNIHKPISVLLASIAAAVGLTMIVQGLLKAAKTGTDPRAASPKDIVVNFAIGAVLISVSTVLGDTLSTVFGDSTASQMSSTTNIIAWSKLVGTGASTTGMDNTVRAVFAFVQIIGLISFLRGWLLVKKALEGGQATVPQGLTHIIGGSMAINIDKMLVIMDKTFGTGIMV